MVLERAAALAAAIVIGGCAFSERLNDGLASYRGRPVAEFTARMGPPQSSREVAGETWHSWRYETFAGGSTRLECTVSFKVDPQGFISGYHWSGNNGACLELSRSF